MKTVGLLKATDYLHEQVEVLLLHVELGRLLKLILSLPEGDGGGKNDDDDGDGDAGGENDDDDGDGDAGGENESDDDDSDNDDDGDGGGKNSDNDDCDSDNDDGDAGGEFSSSLSYSSGIYKGLGLSIVETRVDSPGETILENPSLPNLVIRRLGATLSKVEITFFQSESKEPKIPPKFFFLGSIGCPLSSVHVGFFGKRYQQFSGSIVPLSSLMQSFLILLFLFVTTSISPPFIVLLFLLFTYRFLYCDVFL